MCSNLLKIKGVFGSPAHLSNSHLSRDFYKFCCLLARSGKTGSAQLSRKLPLGPARERSSIRASELGRAGLGRETTPRPRTRSVARRGLRPGASFSPKIASLASLSLSQEHYRRFPTPVGASTLATTPRACHCSTTLATAPRLQDRRMSYGIWQEPGPSARSAPPPCLMVPAGWLPASSARRCFILRPIP
jgi:hypothetical protein